MHALIRENRSKWAVLAYCLLMQALVIGIGTYAFSFLLMPWMAEFSAQRGELMMAITGAAIGTIIFGPFAGIMVDRYSSRVLIAAGGAVLVLGLVIISLAPAPWLIVLTFALVVPVGQMLAGPLISQTLVARMFTERRGVALGISALGSTLGGVAMPPLIVSLLAEHSWRSTVQILAALVFVLVCCLAPLVVRGSVISAAAVKPGGSGHGFDYKLMRSPSVLLLGFCYLIPVALFVSVVHNLGVYASELSIPQLQAAWVIATASIAMAASKIVMGFLVDKFDYKRIYFILSALSLAGMGTIAAFHNVIALAAGLSLVAIAVGGLAPFLGALIAKRYGMSNFGRVIGVVYSMAALAGVMPSFVGWIRDLSGSYDVAFFVVSLLVIPAMLAFIRHMNLPAVASTD